MAVEIASAYVSIIPSARGIEAKIAEQFRKAGDDAARAFERSFSGELGGPSMTRAAGDAGDKVSRQFGNKLSAGVKTAVGLAAATIATLGAVEVFRFGAESFNQFTSIGESVNKLSVLVGDNAGIIENWSKNTASNIGIGQAKALEAAGVYANFFRTVGLGAEDAANMSTSLVDLAADLASFNNANPEEVLDALRSGLAGETEPLRRLGVFLNEAAVQAKAMELGLADSIGELSESAKLQARYALIIEQTGAAQGDFARTSDSAANKQRILAAKFDDLRIKIGEVVAPIAEKLLPVFEDLIGFAGRVADAFNQSGFSGVWDVIKQTWSETAWPAIQETLGDVWNGIVTWAGEKIQQIPAALGGLALGIVDAFANLWDGSGENGQIGVHQRLNEMLDNIPTWIQEKALQVGTSFGGLVGSAVDWADRIWEGDPATGQEGLKVKLDRALDQLPGWIDGRLQAAREAIGRFGPAFSEWVDHLWNGNPDTGEEGLKVKFETLLDDITTWVEQEGAANLAARGAAMAGAFVAGMWDILRRDLPDALGRALAGIVPILVEWETALQGAGARIALSFITGIARWFDDSVPDPIKEMMYLLIPGLGAAMDALIRLGEAQQAQAEYSGTQRQTFATGGVVQGRTGAAVSATVHAGETVLPTHRMPVNAALAAVGLGASAGFSVNQTIYSAEPRRAAHESAREMRKQAMLLGAA